MDQIVLDGMAKWPNVPACTGWLLLDRRGQWRMRDDACQAAGALGDPIRHAALCAFITRNYDVDAQGRWFFQNGPQRVFLDLQYTPFVVRLHLSDNGTCTLIDQCAKPFAPKAVWLDDAGQILFSTLRASDKHGTVAVALLHDHDLVTLADMLSLDDDGTPVSLNWPGSSDRSSEAATFDITPCTAREVPEMFTFVQRPRL